MKELLCSSAALVLILCIAGSSAFGQDYEESTRQGVRTTAKAIAKERASAITSNFSTKTETPRAAEADLTAQRIAAEKEVITDEVATSDALPSSSSSIALTPANSAAHIVFASTSISGAVGQDSPRLAVAEATTPAAGSTSAGSAPAASAANASAKPVAPSINNDASSAATASAAPPTSIYRVGEGDILDIRILNYQVQTSSTLYTVLGGGYLEYPLVSDLLPVIGLTTEEIDGRITSELKRRGVFESPQVVVNVREYVSHTATITGLVENPGAKILRREALPLYVILAEAVPRSDAGQIIITNPASGASRTIDLTDIASSNTLIYAGDVLRVVVRPPQFFYIGGEVGAPGQKDFHIGMTLTQAVLAARGATRNATGRVRIARQGQDGLLVSTEYNLKKILAGQAPDPSLQAGDRVELSRK